MGCQGEEVIGAIDIVDPAEMIMMIVAVVAMTGTVKGCQPILCAKN